MGSHLYFLTFEKGNCQLNLDMLTPSLPLSSDEGRSEVRAGLAFAGSERVSNCE
jgi:hypothetical protein